MANIFTIIGLGAFGSSAALTLQELGNTVIGIDANAKAVEKLNDKLSHAIIADGSLRATLEEIDVAQSQGVLVSIGEDIEASLLCVFYLKELKVSNIWVKVKSEAHRKILNAMGIVDRNIILSEYSMGKRIAQKMHFPLMHEMLLVAPDFFILVLDIPEREETITLGKLLDKHTEVHLFSIHREGKLLVQTINSEMPIYANDRLVLGGSYEALRPVIQELKTR